MSWGTKIALLYIGFVLMIGFMVVKSNRETVDLVSADYYAQELKFQDKIDGQNNMNSLAGKIEFEAKDKSASIQFPKEFIGKKLSGKILFYRPSDATLDISSEIGMNDLGNQVVRNENFKRGLYQMQINCIVDGKSYYYEQQLFMN